VPGVIPGSVAGDRDDHAEAGMTTMVAGEQVTGVLCDLDGVLLDYHRAEQQAFAGVAMRLGLHDVDAARGVYAGINRDLWDAYERGEVSAEQLRVRRWEEWLAAHDLEPREAARVSGTYLDLLTRSPAVMPGAVQALRRMVRHVPVVAVTNGFAEVAHGRLTASGTRGDLHGVVAADDVGAPKPDPAMFSAGLALLGDPAPGTVLMVGDNHHADIVGAAALGMLTAWVAPEDAPEPRAGVATMRARNLADVVDRVWPAD
jgi:HAD superfamily hydrolase (TIGR01509 family)